jgi:arylsulfatase A-like enzyme
MLKRTNFLGFLLLALGALIGYAAAAAYENFPRLSPAASPKSNADEGRTTSAAEPQTPTRKPNILFILVDNLGWGELGCYGGGELRGAPTPRLDRMASEGLRLQNYNVESECSPTRAALLTGRHGIRTGVWRSTPPGFPQGLTQWEVTIAKLLSAQGYATGHFGKWHLGDREGRFPTDQGFDEWYGIPRTSHDCQAAEAPGFDPKLLTTTYILEGRQGEKSRPVEVFNFKARRHIDAEITKRTIDFLQRSQKAGKPFYAYVPLTQVHYPTLPHPDFQGKTGNGDFADAVTEMDHRVGQLLDAVKELDLEDNTLVVFCSDNGPEFRRPWRGTAGPWTGTYHTAMEGALRAPFIARWPGRIKPGRVSNEMVHAVDLFSTLARLGGAAVPNDRAIDGVDQLDFLLGKQEKSKREGFVLFIEDQVRAVKWRNWKLHYVWQEDAAAGAPLKLETPRLFNLLTDPKEETDVAVHNAWVAEPMMRLVTDFQQSVKKYPHVPPGAADPYQPPK